MVYSQARLDYTLKVFRDDHHYEGRGDESELASCNRRPRQRPRPCDVRDGDDLSDEDYNPFESSQRKRAVVKRKTIDDDDLDTDRYGKKARREARAPTLNNTFVTLGLSSKKGILVLSKLAQKHGTGVNDLNITQRRVEEANSGLQPSSSRPLNVLPPDFALHNFLTEADTVSSALPDRALRSGKVRNVVGQGPRWCSQRTNSNVSQGQDQDRTDLRPPSSPTFFVSPFSSVSPTPQANTTVGSTVEGQHPDECEEKSASLGLCYRNPATRPGPSTGTSSAVYIDLTGDTPTPSPPPSTSPAALTVPRTSSLFQDPFSSVKHATEVNAQYDAGAGMGPPTAHTMTISTYFAHPIDFTSTKKLSKQPCHFCRDYRFGILGLGQITCSVVVYSDNPAAYIEMGDGHRRSGKGPTRMCIHCCLARLMIIRCTVHQLEALPASSFPPGAIFSWQEYRAELFSGDFAINRDKKQHRGLHAEFGEPRNEPKKEGKWPVCSVCPWPAKWRCCAWQKRNQTGQECEIPGEHEHEHEHEQTDVVGDGEGKGQREGKKKAIRGCGLLLCNGCKDIVGGRCGGRMVKGELVARVRRGPGGAGESGLGGRADWEFLFPSGLLYKTYFSR